MATSKIRRIVATGLCWPLMLLPGALLGEESLTVAVASNFLRPAQEIGAAFTRTTNIPVRISSGSTGKLYAQIVNGAPYDVFLAADTERPQRLVDEGLAIAESYVLYAAGLPMLWSSDERFSGKDCLRALRSSEGSKIAVANPKTAPYGQAAKLFLERNQLWSELSDRIVYGENVNQAFQFVATRNATFGIVAASLLRNNDTITIACEAALTKDQQHQYVVQQAGVALSQSRLQPQAQRFLRFLRNTEVAALLADYGYQRSEEPSQESEP